MCATLPTAVYLKRNSGGRIPASLAVLAICTAVFVLCRSGSAQEVPNTGSEGTTPTVGADSGSDEQRRRSAARAGARVETLDGFGHWWMTEDGGRRGAAALSAFWSSLENPEGSGAR